MAKRILPTPEQLRELLRYEPDTGNFYWLKCELKSNFWNSKYAGREALTPYTSHGYRRGRVMGTDVYAHRAAWAIHYGYWPRDEIDHINGIGTDNRIDNLREATSSQNSMNVRRHRDGASGYKGVFWSEQRGKWRASIYVNGRDKHLGFYEDPAIGHEAYCRASVKYFGEFSRTH